MEDIRNYINNGEYAEAQKLALANIIADRNITGHGMIYESIGNLLLDFPENHQTPSNYYRELDLSNAVAKITYTVDGVNYTREVFTSLADQLIIIKISADQPGKVTFKTFFVGPLKTNRTKVTVKLVEGADNMLSVYTEGGKKTEENIPNLLHAHSLIKVVADGGSQTAANSSLLIVLVFISRQLPILLVIKISVPIVKHVPKSILTNLTKITSRPKRIILRNIKSSSDVLL